MCSFPRVLSDPSKDALLSAKVTLVGYLDDTVWFGQSKKQIKDALNRADKFYTYAKIKINKTKWEMSTNNKHYNNLESIILNINGNLIKPRLISSKAVFKLRSPIQH